jgi:hypothetical protein
MYMFLTGTAALEAYEIPEVNVVTAMQSRDQALTRRSRQVLGDRDLWRRFRPCSASVPGLATEVFEANLQVPAWQGSPPTIG